MLVAACSGDGGSVLSTPTEPPVIPTLSVLGHLGTEDDVGIGEVTMLLDGEEIGKYVSASEDGFSSAAVAGAATVLEHGVYLLEFRFDRLSRSPAEVSVAAEIVYEIGPDPVQELALGPRTRRIEAGESVRFRLEL